MNLNGNSHDVFQAVSKLMDDIARIFRKATFNKHERALWKKRRGAMSPGQRDRRDVRPAYHPRYERGRNGSPLDRRR